VFLCYSLYIMQFDQLSRKKRKTLRDMVCIRCYACVVFVFGCVTVIVFVCLSACLYFSVSMCLFLCVCVCVTSLVCWGYELLFLCLSGFVLAPCKHAWSVLGCSSSWFSLNIQWHKHALTHAHLLARTRTLTRTHTHKHTHTHV